MATLSCNPCLWCGAPNGTAFQNHEKHCPYFKSAQPQGVYPATKTIKDSNPKDAVGTGKVPFSTVPAQVIALAGLALLEGARKYGRHNYRAIGVRASVYYDATMRHLTSWWEGQDIDPDSDLSHVDKAISSLIVLRDAMLNNKWEDDRPPAVANQNWVADLNVKAKALNEKYPDALEPWTQKRIEKEAA